MSPDMVDEVGDGPPVRSRGGVRLPFEFSKTSARRFCDVAPDRKRQILSVDRGQDAISVCAGAQNLKIRDFFG